MSEFSNIPPHKPGRWAVQSPLSKHVSTVQLTFALNYPNLYDVEFPNGVKRLSWDMTRSGYSWKKLPEVE